jgi:hypothetical protein
MSLLVSRKMPKEKKVKSSKYTFLLKNVNMRTIDEKYKFSQSTDISDNISPVNSTKLSDLGNEKSTPDLISFLDEAKRAHVCHVSMINHTNQTEVGSTPEKYECYWCRYSFTTHGIGCPIRYVPSQAVKTYYSEISRGIRTIKENVSLKRKDIIKDPNITIEKADYYETDGIFCSFNCCQAWINDNKHDSMYDQSHRLLSRMYCDMFGVKSVTIKPAPHWRLRKESGGHHTQASFREGFGKLEYQYCGTFFTYRPIGHMYEEILHF